MTTEQKLLAACVDYRAKLDVLDAENAALKQRILDDNKAYGCELRDFSGTIWDHAQKLQKENAALLTLLDSVQKSHFSLSKDYAALKKALDAQMKYQRELRADRDRLDWLISNTAVERLTTNDPMVARGLIDEEMECHSHE